MGKEKVGIKGKMEKKKAVCYLEDLLKSFKEGTIFLQQGGEQVTLKPAHLVEVELEASAKKGKEKLHIELSWKNEKTLEDTTGLKIFSEDRFSESDASPAEAKTHK